MKQDGSYLTVVSIEEDNQEKWVYNLSIEKYHNYFPNGILAHNECLAKLKDGTIRVLKFNEMNKLISEGKIERIIDANVPAENNLTNPFNKAWERSDRNIFSFAGLKYTDEQFLEFLNSKDGYEFIAKYGNFAAGTNLFTASLALGKATVGLIESIAKGFNNSGKVEVVERVMSQAELDATQSTGLIRGGREGTHFVTNSANNNALRARQRLSLPQTPQYKVRTEVPTGSFSSPSKIEPKFNMQGGGLERTAQGRIPVRIIDIKKF